MAEFPVTQDVIQENVPNDDTSIFLPEGSRVISDDSLPVVILAEDTGIIQGREILLQHTDTISSDDLRKPQINIIDLNLISHSEDNQLTSNQLNFDGLLPNQVEESQTPIAIQSTVSGKILKQSSDSQKLVSYTIFCPNEEAIFTAEPCQEDTVRQGKRPINRNLTKKKGNTDVNEAVGSANYTQLLNNVNKHLLSTNSLADGNGQKPSTIKNTVFHGLKSKPTGMGAVFKSKKSSNLFENLEQFAREGEKEMPVPSASNGDGVSTDNDSERDFEDTLKSRCLRSKVSVKLVPLDMSKISVDKKPKVDSFKNIKKQQNIKEKSIDINKVSKLKNGIVGEQYTFIRGKKKKKKPSLGLLREIDKKPAERFGKIPKSMTAWKKIETIEKTGKKPKIQGRKGIEGEFPCNLCDYVAKIKTHLQVHRAVHIPKWRKCNFCKFESRSEFKMMEHEARHTGEKPFKCKVEGCDYAGACKGDLTKHQRKHQEDKPFKCPQAGCSFGTKWPRNLKHHLTTHSDERPHKCKQCGYAFKRPSDLSYHMYRHNDLKPIKCEKCEFRCKTNFEIKCHMLKHSDVRYFKCTHSGCTQETKTKSDLTKHMKVHCKTQEHILAHIGTMHGSKYAYFCEICKKPFKRYHLLQVHYPRCHTKEELEMLESALQLNMQAIKSEVIDEITKTELAKTNSELNWDCVFVKDERCDFEAYGVTEDQSVNTDEDTTTKTSENQNLNGTNQDHNNENTVSSEVDTTQNEHRNTSDNLNDTNESKKPDVKPAKLECTENSYNSTKPATLAIYDDFRLPLATVGFHFNFIKKGKKTKAWFMDQSYMDETAKKRHQKYLNRKREEMLYGYYNSKRRRKIQGKLTTVYESPEKTKQQFAGGKYFPKNKTKKAIEPLIKLDSSNKTMPKIVIKSSSSESKRLEAKKLLDISIKKSTMSRSHDLKAHKKPKTTILGHIKTEPVKKENAKKPSLKTTIDSKKHKKLKIMKTKKLKKVVKEQYMKPKEKLSIKPKGKPDRKPKVVEILKKDANKIIKPTGKPGRKPKITSKMAEFKKSKMKTYENRMNKNTKTGKPSAIQSTIIKNKPGRKPKSNVVGEKKTKVNKSSLKKTGKKPGRKPKEHVKLPKIQKPKGKPGPKPKYKVPIMESKINKSKGKRGRKPKALQADSTILTEIKQEAVDDFEQMTTSLDNLIGWQDDMNTSSFNDTNDGECEGDVVQSYNITVCQDFNQSHDADLSSSATLSDRIKTNRRRVRNYKTSNDNENAAQKWLASGSTTKTIQLPSELPSEVSDKITVVTDRPIIYKFIGKRANEPETTRTNNESTSNSPESNLTPIPKAELYAKIRSRIASKNVTAKESHRKITAKNIPLERLAVDTSTGGIVTSNAFNSQLIPLQTFTSETLKGTTLIKERDIQPTQKLVSAQTLSSNTLKRMNIQYNSEKNKRNKLDVPQVVIENAEEMNSHTCNEVYLSSLQDSENYDVQEQDTQVFVKEEIIIDLDDENDRDYYRSEGNNEDHACVEDYAKNGIAREHQPVEMDRIIESNGNLFVPYCDDVAVMQASAEVLQEAGGNEQLNEPSAINQLGFVIETVQDSALDVEESQDGNVVVQMLEPAVENSIISKLTDDTDQTLPDSDIDINSSPIKQEPR
ncbi:KRAB [Mytilus coruscus]|uniref:KRAB n=1 Tax=Mytilus coruscus TaxID=42192 RepID=A0A6J8DQM7_MYTCO|nr:KRAB [Mytilus coruscus]